ncbi:MAG: hypothetical protein QM499_01025 [Flavobacteriaceae bacterium]
MWKFLSKIINSESPESSKRFYGLWGMVLVTIIVIYSLIKGEANGSIINMFYALLGLVLSLAGVATYQAVSKHISNKNEDDKTNV